MIFNGYFSTSTIEETLSISSRKEIDLRVVNKLQKNIVKNQCASNEVECVYV